MMLKPCGFILSAVFLLASSTEAYSQTSICPSGMNCGQVMTVSHWTGFLGVAIYGESAERIYNWLATRGMESGIELIPQARVVGSQMECTYREGRSSPYQCAFSIDSKLNSIPGL